MMIVTRHPTGEWGVVHAGRWLKQRFSTEAEAERWADSNVDDQMFDGPNCLAPPLEYDDSYLWPVP